MKITKNNAISIINSESLNNNSKFLMKYFAKKYDVKYKKIDTTGSIFSCVRSFLFVENDLMCIDPELSHETLCDIIQLHKCNKSLEDWCYCLKCTEITRDNLLNKNKNDVCHYLEQNLFEYRIFDEDGKIFTGSCDWNANRINLHIVKNIVRKISFG